MSLINQGVNEMEKEIKLNWNGFTDRQQEHVEMLVNREVFTLCNELIMEAEEDVYFTNDWDEEANQPVEIFQYFIISDYLYHKFDKIGGVCLTEFKGLYIWGKCDFGSCMTMNYDLKRVTKSIIKKGDK